MPYDLSYMWNPEGCQRVGEVDKGRPKVKKSKQRIAQQYINLNILFSSDIYTYINLAIFDTGSGASPLQLFSSKLYNNAYIFLVHAGHIGICMDDSFCHAIEANTTS